MIPWLPQFCCCCFFFGHTHGMCFPGNSAGEESTCNAADSWVRKICWKRDRLATPVFLGFPGNSVGKESTCNVGDLDSIPGLHRSPREGKGYPHRYSGLENSMDYLQGVKESCTWLSNFHFHNLLTLFWFSHYGIDQMYIIEVQQSWCLIYQVYLTLYLHLYLHSYPYQHSGSLK